MMIVTFKKGSSVFHRISLGLVAFMHNFESVS